MRQGTQQEARAGRARQGFRELRTPAEERQREQAIAALPQKEWRGKTVYALTCQARTGRGPHVQWVPEGLLWALIDLNHWCCPHHGVAAHLEGKGAMGVGDQHSLEATSGPDTAPTNTGSHPEG